MEGFGDCLMPNNQIGLCIPLKDCSILNALAKKKRLRTADRRYLQKSQCGYLNLTPLVCCPRADGSPLRIDDLPTDCGRLHHDYIEYLIVGGVEAKIYDSPWLALLQYEKCMSIRIQSVEVCLFLNCVDSFMNGYLFFLILIKQKERVSIVEEF